MSVAAATLANDKALHLFDNEERDDADEDAQADSQVVAVALSVPMGVSVRFVRVAVASFAVAVTVPLLNTDSAELISFDYEIFTTCQLQQAYSMLGGHFVLI